MKKLRRFPVYLSLILLIFLGFSLPARAQTIICLETTIGEICMELLETEAPVTAQNFLAYVNQGSYRNSFFHQSEKGAPAYLQAGRYADNGGGDLDALQEIFRRPAIGSESSVANVRGTVASVRDDADDPNSVTSQFLINVTDNPSLDDGSHTVFARIIADDMDLVDVMADFPVVALDNDGLSRVPVVGQEIPVINSPRVMILDAAVFEGDVCELEAGGCVDGGDGGTGGGDGGDGETPTPGEGETLYEDAVCVDTNVGEFCMELFPDTAPNTVQNFLNYITSGRYDNTIIHRSEPDFVIQGGGYYSSPLGSEVPKDPAINNEFSRSNLRGTVAMAKLSGQPDSATSEWFVNLSDNTSLDSDDGRGGGFFTVFAEIITGMSVVDEIGGLPRLNLSGSLGGAFGSVPRSRPIGSAGVVAEDLVLVNRIYVTDVITDGTDDGSTGGGDGGGDGGDTVTTTATYSLLSRSIAFPVYIDGILYRITMYHDTTQPGVVMQVDTSRIYTMADTGQETATLDMAARTLVIPSVNVSGTVITDVTFTLTDYETLTFKLSSYTRAAE